MLFSAPCWLSALTAQMRINQLIGGAYNKLDSIFIDVYFRLYHFH